MKQRNAQEDYTGELPSMREVRGKTEREKIKLLVLPTIERSKDRGIEPKPEGYQCETPRHVLKATARLTAPFLGT